MSSAPPTGSSPTGAPPEGADRGFRRICLGVGATYVLLGAMMIARGVGAMAEYGVPAATLASPHYADAIFWVYLHMLVLGLVIGAIGVGAESARQRLGFARLMLGAHLVYAFLDVRSSDSALGTGLYQGGASIGPALIALVVTALFAWLSVPRTRARSGSSTPLT